MPWDLCFVKIFLAHVKASHILWNGIIFGLISFVILTFTLFHLFTRTIWFSFEA
jgi:hypothetical protein